MNNRLQVKSVQHKLDKQTLSSPTYNIYPFSLSLLFQIKLHMTNKYQKVYETLKKKTSNGNKNKIEN